MGPIALTAAKRGKGKFLYDLFQMRCPWARTALSRQFPSLLIDCAIEEPGEEDYSEENIRLVRIKLISGVGN